MVGLDKTLDNPRVIDVANCLTAREDRGLSNRKSEGTMIAIREATKKGYAIAEPGDSVNLEQPNSKTRRGRVGKGVANTLTTGCQQGVLVEPKIIDALYSNRPPREYEDAAPTLRSDRHGLMVSIGLVQPKDREYKKKGGVREEHLEITKDGSAPCLRSGVNPERVVYDNGQNFRIRKLTPRECWRLQGIPDHYFEKASAVNSNSQLYKQAGNACTVNVIYEIAKRI